MLIAAVFLDAMEISSNPMAREFTTLKRILVDGKERHGGNRLRWQCQLLHGSNVRWELGKVRENFARTQLRRALILMILAEMPGNLYIKDHTLAASADHDAEWGMVVEGFMELGLNDCFFRHDVDLGDSQVVFVGEYRDGGT